MAFQLTPLLIEEWTISRGNKPEIMKKQRWMRVMALKSRLVFLSHQLIPQQTHVTMQKLGRSLQWKVRQMLKLRQGVNQPLNHQDLKHSICVWSRLNLHCSTLKDSKLMDLCGVQLQGRSQEFQSRIERSHLTSLSRNQFKTPKAR